MTNWMINLLSLLLYAALLEGASKRFFTDFLQDLPTPGTGGPSFDTSVASNVTGLVGKTVKLTCRVKNLGNRTVSWVRHRDIHLLTVGRYTYTSDQRFEAMHSPHAEDWTLRIRYAQRKDSGVYECQISTTPPIGHSVYLNIVEPITEIIGGPELHINKGSTINLTCIVKFAPEPPPTVIWSHNRQIINFDSPRGGISLVTEKGILTTSRLLVQKAIQADSGLYTCTPSNANPTSVRVHIVDGEHPAAMHHGDGVPLKVPSFTIIFLLTFALFWLHYYYNNEKQLQQEEEVEVEQEEKVRKERQQEHLKQSTQQQQQQQQQQKQQQQQQQQQKQEHHHQQQHREQQLISESNLRHCRRWRIGTTKTIINVKQPQQKQKLWQQLQKQQQYQRNNNCFDMKCPQCCLLWQQAKLELPNT